MVSAPRFKPVIPDLVRVLVQKETNWGVDPWVNFLGRWRINYFNASTAPTNPPGAGEISIVLSTAGAGTVRVNHIDANGDNLSEFLTVTAIPTGDKLMLGGDISLAQSAAVTSTAGVATFTVNDIAANDHDGQTHGDTLAAVDFLVNRRISFGHSNTGRRARVLVPCEPISIMEEIQYFTDENYRGRFARDFDVYGGTRMVTGSLTGNVYLGSDEDETTTASPLGHLLVGFWGSDRTVRIGTSDFYAHNFFSTDIPGSLSVEVQDNINEQTGVAAASRQRLTPVYLGTMLERFSLSFDANDGLMTFSTDFKGRNQIFMDPPAISGNRYPEIDKTAEASIGWHGSVYYGTLNTANPLPTVGKLLSAELSLDREIDMHSTEGDNQLPTIRPTRPVRATFTATVEFTDYEDLKRYSSDNYANDNTTDFTDSQERWIFRFANKRNISTDLPDGSNATTLGLAGSDNGQLSEDSDGVLDVVFHAAAYSESPVSINRGEFSNTLEFSCRAFLEESPNWFGADPGAGTAINSPDPGEQAAQRGSSVVQMRLVNKKNTPY